MRNFFRKPREEKVFIRGSVRSGLGFWQGAFRVILREPGCINRSRVDVLSTRVTSLWRDSFCPPGSSCIRHLRQLELSRWHGRVIGISVAGWKPNKIYPFPTKQTRCVARRCWRTVRRKQRRRDTVVPPLRECKIGFYFASRPLKSILRIWRRTRVFRSVAIVSDRTRISAEFSVSMRL